MAAAVGCRRSNMLLAISTLLLHGAHEVHGVHPLPTVQGAINSTSTTTAWRCSCSWPVWHAKLSCLHTLHPCLTRPLPAGEVSFRAKVGRRHKLSARDVYPDELGIMARYKGEGRVAMPGYKSPRWVEGELLVFTVGASPLTSGAELGFVWNVPGEKRFLILLNKLDLQECEV